jgi:hypothetical protein
MTDLVEDGEQYKDFLKEIGDSGYGPVTDSCDTVMYFRVL